jgi:hypothetical protein
MYGERSLSKPVTSITAVLLPFVTYLPALPRIKPCSPLKVNQYSGEISHFHLQGPRISRERNQCEAGSTLCSLPENNSTYVGHFPLSHFRLKDTLSFPKWLLFRHQVTVLFCWVIRCHRASPVIGSALSDGPKRKKFIFVPDDGNRHGL